MEYLKVRPFLRSEYDQEISQSHTADIPMTFCKYEGFP